MQRTHYWTHVIVKLFIVRTMRQLCVIGPVPSKMKSHAPSTGVRNFSESLELVLHFGVSDVVVAENAYAWMYAVQFHNVFTQCKSPMPFCVVFFFLFTSKSMRWIRDWHLIFFHSNRSTFWNDRSLRTRVLPNADYVNDEHHFGLRVTIILHRNAFAPHRQQNKVKTKNDWFYLSHARVHVNLLVSAGSGGLCFSTQHTTSMWIQISTF